jgi:CBS domain-containing protein
LEDLRRRPVSEVMQREVVTLAPGETLDLTQDLMSLGRVRHLPVLEGGRLVGMVSQRDLLEASLSKTLEFDAGSRRAFLRSVQAAEVMSRRVATIGPDTPLADAARRLVEHKIGCLVVVDGEGVLLGLVTDTDLLAAAYLTAEDDETGRTIEVATKTDFAKWFDRELDDLRRVRDELRVKAHLGKAEVRDRWEALERSYATLEGRAKHAGRMAEEPLQKLDQDVRKLVDDLRDGYRRIRDAL